MEQCFSKTPLTLKRSGDVIRGDCLEKGSVDCRGAERCGAYIW